MRKGTAARATRRVPDPAKGSTPSAAESMLGTSWVQIGTAVESRTRRFLYEEKVPRGESSTSSQLYEWGHLFTRRTPCEEDDREKVLRGEFSTSRLLYEWGQLYEQKALRGEND